MTIPRRLENAATRLEETNWRIDMARKKKPTLESLQEWLAALTDYSQALTAIEQANNESVHEKLHQLAGHVRLGGFESPGKRRSAARPLARK